MTKASVAVTLVVVAVLAGYPVALIWSVNTLFKTSIPITGLTWLAALLLSSPFINSVSNSRK